MFGQTIGSYADELNTEIEETVDTEVEVLVVEIEAPKTNLEQALEYIESAEENVESAVFFEDVDASANATNDALDEYAEDAAEFETAASETIEFANTANTSDDRDEAYAAKDDAVARLADAEADLISSNDAVDAAREAYDAADAAYVSANDEYTAARNALTQADTDTQDAKRALDAAKAEVEAGEAKKASLEKIEDQYYGLMLYYYRYHLNDDTVYNEDGTLNIEESAKLLSEDQINKFAKNGNEQFFRYGRYLTRELVQYMVYSKSDVDPASAEFTFGQNGSLNKACQEALIYTNNSGNDQNVLRKTKDISGTDVSPAEVEKIHWENANYNAGRSSRVQVTYKDVSGNTHTEYYNYVIKSSTYEDELDFETGNIYLALITENEDGKHDVNRVEDENNFDNYQKLVNTIAELTAAKNAYEDALNRVAALESTISALETKANASQLILETLRGELDAAKTTLEAAEANKEVLQGRYEEAKEAVEGIDLSRFDVVSVNVVPVSNEEPAVVPATPAPAPAVVPAAPAAAPVLAAPAGEEEEEIEQVAAEVTIDEEETAL
ncbi:MAG: hypothetical protein IKZ39_02450, partial [Lachnospiraceae bacterium]|nr:hypothetical protein [Lachnospiraceae bacterium]